METKAVRCLCMASCFLAAILLIMVVSVLEATHSHGKIWKSWHACHLEAMAENALPWQGAMEKMFCGNNIVLKK